MDLILVILIFIILICVIKTREYFYAPTAWSGHGHKHANDHHTPTHSHKTLPIANPNFKYKDRQMICELLSHQTQCEHYGCEWDSTDICRNPIKGNEKICNHVNNGTYTEAQKSVICNELDNCILDPSDNICKSFPYCSSVDTIEDINKRKVICNLKTKCKIDKDDKCIDTADSDDICNKFKNTKRCRELTNCTLKKNNNAECIKCINSESDPKQVITVWDINNSKCFTFKDSKDLADLKKKIITAKAPEINKNNYVLGAAIGDWKTEIIGCGNMPAINFNDNKPSGCGPNCDLKPLAALSIKNSMCVPKIHTCSDLTNEDTCESYPNIRYCRWDNHKCVDRIKNTKISSFTLPAVT